MNLPRKYHRAWIDIWLVLAVTIWLVWNVLKIALRQTNALNQVAILLVSMASSFVPSTAGFLDAKFLMTLSFSGIVTGLVAVFVFSARGGGWEDLIGPVVFLECFILGTIIGGIGEVLLRIVKRR